MVAIRPPAAGEQISQFWNAPFLRGSSELVLKTPREGFFSTPAFQANWSTNPSNQARVTANQTLIVALGQSIHGTDPTIPSATPGLDATHAAPGTACYGCHQLLDPMREAFAANYSWGYGQQTDPAFAGQPGQLAIQNVITPLSSVDDLANALASHPSFAQAWAQKLCYYANSAPCQPDDPEFERIVSDFASSNFQWNTLVREIFASPLTTNAKPTATRLATGVVVSVTRLDHLCAALQNRLGIADPCVLDPLHRSQLTRPSQIELVATGLPSDGYGRGSVIPTLPNAPTMFYRAAAENICEGVAAQVIDGTTSKWSSTQPEPAIADFVATMIGFTASDPRASGAQSLLAAHFQAAVASGETQADALRSTFVVACLAPSFIGIGM